MVPFALALALAGSFGLGFIFQASGFGSKGLGVWALVISNKGLGVFFNLGIRVQGLGFRDEGLGMRVGMRV